MPFGPHIRTLLARSGRAADPAVAERLEHYYELLQKWGAKIDLTSSTGPRVIGPLFEEAIWAARFYPSGAERHLDIGSGAGFPAIPLAVLLPRVRLELVESRERRALFLETVLRELHLEGSAVHNVRLDEYLSRRQEAWDCVSWKAVRLGTRDLRRLLAQAGPQTELWMFHGGRLPVADPGEVEARLELRRREACAGRENSFLSIYTVSRET